MKKLISLLLAVSVVVASTVASAADLTADGNQRNNGYDVMPDSYVAGQIATYRPGDVITFKGSESVNFETGDVVTFISSRVDAGIDDTTVMFIDQVTVTANEQDKGFTYKIREGLTQGAYKLDIKNGSAEKATYYYFVAAPEVKIATVDGGTDKSFDTTRGTAFIGVLTMGTSGATYKQVGLGDFGMDLSYDTAEGTMTGRKTFTLPAGGSEIEGSVDWHFAIVVDNAVVEDAGENEIDAKGYVAE